MGNTGSFTRKAKLGTSFFVFTTWTNVDMKMFLMRGIQELAESFALRRYEMEFLLGKNLVDFKTCRSLFNDVFDTDKNQLVDKFEVMCMVCLASKMSNMEKVYFLFDLFNFNNKGYLFESEISLLLMAVTRGAYKVDQKFLPPNTKTIEDLTKKALKCAKYNPDYVRKPELVEFVVRNTEVMAFLDSWRGHAAQVCVLT